MTELKKIVRRETNSRIREMGKERPIIIELAPPNLLYFRAKGCRRKYVLTAQSCYIMAVRTEIESQKRQSKAERAAIRVNKAAGKPTGALSHKEGGLLCQ